MRELAMLTATEALARIAAGRLSVVEWHEAQLARIHAAEPTIRAFTAHDPAHIRAHPPSTGKLAGVPLGVKDVLDTADLPTEYGSSIWTGHRPRADAAAVALATSAGAVVMGKTVTTEFATRRPGPTANPHHTGHTPGGSSSGSAAGVAAGFFPVAFGTQTAGSIIRPAAFCGVVGFKPTYGTIPRIGMKLMSESLDTIGALARSLADAALLVSATGGGDLGNPDQATGAAPRIGICAGPKGAIADDATKSLLDRAAVAMSKAGAKVSDATLPTAFHALEQSHPIMMNGESALSMAWELAHHASQISDGLRDRLHWGAAQGIDALRNAQLSIDRLRLAFDDFIGGYDILLTPSAPGEAPSGLEWTGEPSFNGAWTALHVPCITVPAGTGPMGLPLGIQIIGRRGRDRAALAWAGWVQAHLGG